MSKKTDVFLVLRKDIGLDAAVLGVSLDEGAANYTAQANGGIVALISSDDNGDVLVCYNTLFIVVFNNERVVKVIDTKLSDPSRANARPVVSKPNNETTEVWLFAYTTNAAIDKAKAALAEAQA